MDPRFVKEWVEINQVCNYNTIILNVADVNFVETETVSNKQQVQNWETSLEKLLSMAYRVLMTDVFKSLSKLISKSMWEIIKLK